MGASYAASPVPISDRPAGPGAVVGEDGVHFRVWAPRAKAITVVFPASGDRPDRRFELERGGDAYFTGTWPESRAGDRYFFSLDGGEWLPDPASRWQPEGVEGPSMVVDPRAFRWTDRNWTPPEFRDLIIYELHVGTFTPEGTFAAAIERLDGLRDLGIRAIELMPVGDFPGGRNWGYDGVALFAPSRAYGRPDDLRALVDAAHARGIAVILDVVYNHLGPHGNRLREFAREFFDSGRQTPWGDALHFDGPRSAPVRAFFRENLRYWVRDFHMDGFRLDATHAIHDRSEHHILRELRDTAHDCGAFVIAEDERNEEILLSREGYHLDGAWADDFHHTLQVSLLPRSVYSRRFTGERGELVEILQHGWAGRRPAPHRAHLVPQQFVFCISNHDQVGNRPFGDRLHALTSPEAYRAASLLLCLQPGIPLLFMGQEWAASTPFQYFTDHPPSLGRLVQEGRRRELRQEAAYEADLARGEPPDPQDRQTFEASKLAWDEMNASPHREIRTLYREGLALRRAVPFCRARDFSDFAVIEIEPGVVALGSTRSAENWLLLYVPGGAAEIDLAQVDRAPVGGSWEIVIASNEARFGGGAPARLASDGRILRTDAPETILLRRGGTA